MAPRASARASASLTAAEDERVTALQADHLEACVRVGDEQLVDLLLMQRLAGDPQSVRRRLVDELARDEPVMDEDVAGLHELEPAAGDQPWIARTGANEGDAHGSALSTSAWKKSRRSS